MATQPIMPGGGSAYSTLSWWFITTWSSARWAVASDAALTGLGILAFVRGAFRWAATTIRAGTAGAAAMTCAREVCLDVQKLTMGRQLGIFAICVRFSFLLLYVVRDVSQRAGSGSLKYH